MVLGVVPRSLSIFRPNRFDSYSLLEEVLMSQYEFIDKRVPIALNNPSIYHDISRAKTVRYAVALVRT